jgi:membrane-bound ClpP family serine protease
MWPIHPWLSILAQASSGAPVPALANPMDKQYLLWGLLCLGAAIILFVAEIFLPSAGIIALGAAASCVAGIALLFLYNPATGVVGLVITLAVLPFFFAFLLKLWPNTPIARLLLLKNTQAVRIAEAPGDGDDGRSPLVGKRGKAVSDLPPVGMCMIDGKRTECLAEEGMIPAGNDVRVVSVDGMQIKVRAEE